MQFNLIYSPISLNNLKNISEYFDLQQGPVSGKQIVKIIRNEVDKLRSSPDSRPLSAEYPESLGIRRLFIKKYHYKIFYTIDRHTRTVTILHIRHASRSTLPAADVV